MGRARDFAARGEQGRSALVLDASAADTDVHENILLDGTDASSTNAGFNIMQEDFSTDVPLDLLPPGSRPILNDDLIWFHTWYGAAGSQVISEQTTTKCNFDAVKWDWQGNANMIDDPSQFTVPVSGFYYLRFCLYYGVSAHDSVQIYHYIQPRLNGSSFSIHDYRTHGYGGGSGYSYHSVGTIEASGIVQLNKGDTIDTTVYFYKNASVTHTVYTYEGTLDGMTGCLLQRLDD